MALSDRRIKSSLIKGWIRDGNSARNRQALQALLVMAARRGKYCAAAPHSWPPYRRRLSYTPQAAHTTPSTYSGCAAPLPYRPPPSHAGFGPYRQTGFPAKTARAFPAPPPDERLNANKATPKTHAVLSRRSVRRAYRRLRSRYRKILSAIAAPVLYKAPALRVFVKQRKKMSVNGQ